MPRCAKGWHGISSSVAFNFIFWDKISHWTGSSPLLLDCLARKPQGISILPALELQAPAKMSGFLHACYGTKLTDWTTSPVQNYPICCNKFMKLRHCNSFSYIYIVYVCLLCVWVYCPACISVYHVPAVPTEARRGKWIPLLSQELAAIWVLEPKPWLSERRVNSELSPAVLFLFVFFFLIKKIKYLNRIKDL